MRVLSNDECNAVTGAGTCEYADMNTMLGNSGAIGAVSAMVGFLFGPAVSGIAGAGTAAASMAAHGVYNFAILVSDLTGGCDGYTTSC